MATARTDPKTSAQARWITPATQARSRRTLRAILDNARHLLNEHPFDEITVAEICRGASCSPPAFYQRFKDKEALLHAIHEQFTQESIAMVRDFIDPEVWQDKGLGEFLHALVEGILTIEFRSGGLRTTAVRRSYSDPRFAERIRAIRIELYDRLAETLERLPDQHRHEDPARAARFLVRLIQGAAARHVEGPHLEDHPITREELVEDLFRVAVDYLGVQATA